MKIALIGTHGVGKTTLAFELAARLKRLDRGVDLVTEVARDCPLPINRETTLEAQNWILHTQVAREIAAAAKAEIVVCDRAVLDNYAYLAHAVGRRSETEAWVRDWCSSYSVLFKIPIGRAPRFDGTRDLDASFQRGIDETLEILIIDLGVNVIRLDARASGEWSDQVLRRLDLPLEPPQRDLFADPA